MEAHECSPQNAARFLDWIQNRGGITIWTSVNFSNPGAEWSAPYLNSEKLPSIRPTWQVGEVPSRIIMNPADVAVVIPQRVETISLTVKKGDSMNLVLTDASQRKLDKALARAGKGSWYEFDDMEAHIFTARERVPLLDFLAREQSERSAEL